MGEYVGSHMGVYVMETVNKKVCTCFGSNLPQQPGIANPYPHQDPPQDAQYPVEEGQSLGRAYTQLKEEKNQGIQEGGLFVFAERCEENRTMKTRN